MAPPRTVRLAFGSARLAHMFSAVDLTLLALLVFSCVRSWWARRGWWTSWARCRGGSRGPGPSWAAYRDLVPGLVRALPLRGDRPGRRRASASGLTCPRPSGTFGAMSLRHARIRRRSGVTLGRIGLGLLLMATDGASGFALAADNARETFVQVCSICHGVGGKGDGPSAAGLNPRPADFTNCAIMRSEEQTSEL